MLAIRADRLIDGTGREPVGPAVVLVDDGRISRVGRPAEVSPPPGAEIVDLGGHTILPGLVDAHTHYGAHFPGGVIPGGNYEILLQATTYLRQDLLSGVTTARTLGERDFLDLAYRQAVAQAWVQGPRTLVAGRAIQPTTMDMPVTDLHVDGPDEMRRAVRENVKRGADVIKLFLNPSFRSPTPLRPSFSREEIAAGVDEAHRAGRPVAAHVLGGPAMDDAIAAGVDTFEHAILITDEQLDQLAKHGRWLVLTQTQKLWQAEGSTPVTKDDMHRAVESLPRRAQAAGVNVTVGTDTAHGMLPFEVACLVRGGIPPMDALRAATSRAAEAIGFASEVGTLEPGKRADAIAVRGDPLSDIGLLGDVTFVMKEGVVMKRA